MKLAVILLCVFLAAELHYAPATARKKSRKESRKHGGRKARRSCEPYSAGELCEPYLKGQQIYVNLERGSQSSLSGRVGLQYDLLKKFVSPGCKDYVLPTLCNYVFPPCDLPYTAPKPRWFCRDDCMILQNNFCRVEFERARNIEAIQHLLPDCSSMPSKGAPGYNTCIRVVPPEKRPNFKVFLDDITMFERKPVIFKCRLSSKNLKTNITWYKNRQRIPDHKNFKILNFRWGSRLKIRRARVGDAGIYQCEVEGPGGTVTAQAQLKINKLTSPVERTQTTTTKISESTTEVTPAIKETTGTLSPYGVCEPYRGNACAEFIGNESVWVEFPGRQQLIERKLGEALSVIKATDEFSENCTKYGIPGMCFHIFPTCNPLTRDAKPRLCREDCYALFDDVCLVELQYAAFDPTFRNVLPDCSALPERGSKDHSYCKSIGIPGLKTPTPSPPNPLPLPRPEVKDQSCYNGTGEMYIGRANVSSSGRPCRLWPNMYPPKHNYCRNPGGLDASPWCYVGVGDEKEFCDIEKCAEIGEPGKTGRQQPQGRPVARTIYVISAIMAVLIVAFLSIIVYLKVQHRKGALPQGDQASSGSISKSTQSTLQQPSFDLKQSITEIKSCVFNQNHAEVNHGKVMFLEALGEGGFAKVCKGSLIKMDSEMSGVEVAIKRLKSDVPPAAIENFKKETTILANLQDINILCLIGVSTGEEPRFMIFEYYTDIDLNRFLLDNASKLSGTIPCDLSEYNVLLDFALQIASGMDFLVEHKFVHRDLAARNCYVTEDNIVKISNLGIGSYKYPKDYSWVHSSALLPVRWMAPEALNSLHFTHQTDVWSYGVLLWELYTYGCHPYAGYSNQEAIEQIRSLQLLSCPDDCPARMFGLMRECWEESPSDRPPFSETCSRLREWAGDSIAESH